MLVFKLDPRPLAFAIPLSHTYAWKELGTVAISTSTVLPSDSRWVKGGLR